MKYKYSATPDPNQYRIHTGSTLTLMMQGKIQYTKIKKGDNMEVIHREVTSRGIGYTRSTGWKQLSELIKSHELTRATSSTHPKFFRPVTDYSNFKWST